MPCLCLPECLAPLRCLAPAAWRRCQTAAITSGTAPSPLLWRGAVSPSPLPPAPPPLPHLARAPPSRLGRAGLCVGMVCVATIAAMDLGRRVATRAQLSSAEAGVVTLAAAAGALAARAAAAAETWFWAALQDMCSAGAVPEAWRDLPGPARPFFVRRRLGGPPLLFRCMTSGPLACVYLPSSPLVELPSPVGWRRWRALHLAAP